MMNKQELKSDLEQFRHSVGKLMDLEDELTLVSMELNGDKLSSPRIKSKEEAKYKQGSRIYHNEIADLMDREQRLIQQRDYYLFRVRRVAEFLQGLSDEEVELLEYRYWHGYSLESIAEMYFYSKAGIYKKINAIFEKVNTFTQN